MTTRGKTTGKSERLSVLNNAEICFFVSGGKMLRMTAILSCAVILAVRLFRMSFPLSMNAMPSGKKFARCMATIPKGRVERANQTLLVYVDDATSRLMQLLFASSEST